MGCERPRLAGDASQHSSARWPSSALSMRSEASNLGSGGRAGEVNYSRTRDSDISNWRRGPSRRKLLVSPSCCNPGCVFRFGVFGPRKSTSNPENPHHGCFGGHSGLGAKALCLIAHNDYDHFGEPWWPLRLRLWGMCTAQRGQRGWLRADQASICDDGIRGRW